MLGPAVHAGLLTRLWIDREAELGGDHHPVTERRQSLADDLLIGEGAVDLGRVKQSEAKLHRLADELDALLFAQGVAVAEVQAHAAEADRRHLKAASEYAFLHLLILPQFAVRRSSANAGWPILGRCCRL